MRISRSQESSTPSRTCSDMRDALAALEAALRGLDWYLFGAQAALLRRSASAADATRALRGRRYGTSAGDAPFCGSRAVLRMKSAALSLESRALPADACAPPAAIDMMVESDRALRS